MSPREANDNAPPTLAGLDQPLDTPAAKVLGREPVVLPKRFYTSVATTITPAGHAVLLDGRAIKTPKRQPLAVPNPALADAIAAEWLAQGEHIDPSTMPITRLANTTLDAVIPHPRPVASDIVDFSGSDALCYRAAEPAALAQRQSQVWDPILAWANQTLGARFVTQVGVTHVAQPPQTLAAIARTVAALSPWQLAPVHVMTTITGSAVLALAIAHRHLDLDAAWFAAHVDEDWQIATWGDDDEAQFRRARRWLEIKAAYAMLATLS